MGNDWHHITWNKQEIRILNYNAISYKKYFNSGYQIVDDLCFDLSNGISGVIRPGCDNHNYSFKIDSGVFDVIYTPVCMVMNSWL